MKNEKLARMSVDELWMMHKELGAILSIPRTLFVRALVLEGDPGSLWLRWLSGDRTATPAAAARDALPRP